MFKFFQSNCNRVAMISTIKTPTELAQTHQIQLHQPHQYSVITPRATCHHHPCPHATPTRTHVLQPVASVPQTTPDSCAAFHHQHPWQSTIHPHSRPRTMATQTIATNWLTTTSLSRPVQHESCSSHDAV